MFKIKSFEEELAKNMEQKLVSNQSEKQFSFDRIAKAVDFINSAAMIFDDTGFYDEAEILTSMLEKIASDGIKKKSDHKKKLVLGDLTKDEMKFYQSLPQFTKSSLDALIKKVGPNKELYFNDFVEEVKLLYAISKSKKHDSIEFESVMPESNPKASDFTNLFQDKKKV